MTIHVETIDDCSPHLADVIRLWRANSNRLGYYPEGAFYERARKRQIIVALLDGTCRGYVLYYRSSRRKAIITHLCVDEVCRGQGVAKHLIDAIRVATNEMLGIGLRCRRDFPTWSVWPRLGFVATDEQPGRAKEGSELTYFWLSHNQPSLLADLQPDRETALDVVIDANVFYDLDDLSRNGAEESIGLKADWLSGSLRLCITEELFNEIHRQPDPELREKRLRSARAIDCLESNTSDYLAVEPEVRRIVGEPRRERDASDLRQLARAISAQATAFVTRDQSLLEFGDDIYAAYGLSILSPSQLVARFEELRHERLYQRERFAGTTIRKHRRSYIADLAAAFHDSGSGEKCSALEKRLRFYSSDPEKFACYVVCDETPPSAPHPLALYVLEKRERGVTRVPFFRIQGPAARTLNTLFKALLAEIVERAIQCGSEIIIFDEARVNEESAESLSGAGFLPAASVWVKACPRLMASPRELARALAPAVEKLSPQCRVLCETVDKLMSSTIHDEPRLASEIEHLLWPAKMLGCGIPTYVVPIKPKWATDLFDSGLGDQILCGADAALALNPESVYYRSRRPNVLRPPGRILWYVSQHKRIAGAKRLRACSRLVDVVIGPARTLFRQYRRLGVYRWNDVAKTADSEGRLMSLLFDDTERLAKPTPFESLRSVLERHGTKSNFQSPVEIPEQAFAELYAGSARESCV
jgi:predicted nucleic acid-binding protein/GNAT superfamily N-acetyltransferase